MSSYNLISRSYLRFSNCFRNIFIPGLLMLFHCMFFHCNFFMWTILKVFIEFVITLLLFFMFLVFFFFFFLPQGLQDLCSLTRDQTFSLCIRGQSLNHWTTREVPVCFILNYLTIHLLKHRLGICLLPQSSVSCFFISSTSFYLEVKHFSAENTSQES